MWTCYGQTENKRWVKWMTAFSWTKLIFHTRWRKKAQHMILRHRIAKRSRNCCSQKRYLVDYYVEENILSSLWSPDERERMVKQSNTFTSRSILTLPSESLERQLLTCQELVLLISAVFTAPTFWGPAAAALVLSGKPGPEKSFVFKKKEVKWESEEYLVQLSHYSSLLGFHFKGKDNREVEINKVYSKINCPNKINCQSFIHVLQQRHTKPRGGS